jgi:Flp pilus assembly pilin Flp
MLNAMKRLFIEEEGISSVEYAILLAFIAAALVIAVVALRDEVTNAFAAATNCLKNAASTGTC